MGPQPLSVRRRGPNPIPAAQPVGAGEPREHDRNAPREHGLQGPDGRELIDPGRLEGGELGGVLSGSTTNFCARVPCFPALCAERALP
jgi:hypothetical protein